MSRRARPTSPILTTRQLNRATLARQLLLERAELGTVEAIEQVAGLQAQEPASPYLALWARLSGFDARSLHAAFHDRSVVKTSLMRVTLHAVSRRDYRAFLPAMLPVLQMPLRRGGVTMPGPELVGEWVTRILEFTARPRRSSEVRDHVRELVGDALADDLWWLVRRHAPLVNVPDGVPWAFSRRPSLIAAERWLGDDWDEAGAATEHLVRRYLGAFGPATAADVAQWSALPIGRLRPALDAVGTRRFTDEQGRLLYDLEDAPLPAPDVEPPVRLLPMWDNALLAYADRTRIVSDADRALVIARNGDVAPTFLVDGVVGGLWWTEPDTGGRNRIALEPFRPVAASVRRALEDEAERLLAFVEPHEPAVYARYRNSGARRR